MLLLVQVQEISEEEDRSGGVFSISQKAEEMTDGTLELDKPSSQLVITCGWPYLHLLN